MTALLLSIGFDAVVALLLAITIGFCWKLNARIRILQDSKSELAELIAQFNESTERAKVSILDIQNASKLITESMQVKLEKANYLADDLSYLIEKGNKMTGQNDAARDATRTSSAPAPVRPGAPPAQVSAEPSQDKMPRAQSMLGKLGTRNPSETRTNETKAPSRSRAEQELLDALKSDR